MLCFKEMHRYCLSAVCGGKRFAVSPCNKKNGDVFASETSQNTSLITELPEACECQRQCPGSLALTTSADAFCCCPSVSWGSSHVPRLLISKPISCDAVCPVHFKKRKSMPRHPAGTGQSHSRMTFLLENVFCL